jgi:hypothetical protein
MFKDPVLLFSSGVILLEAPFILVHAGVGWVKIDGISWYTMEYKVVPPSYNLVNKSPSI